LLERAIPVPSSAVDVDAGHLPDSTVLDLDPSGQAIGIGHDDVPSSDVAETHWSRSAGRRKTLS
jgi:hypothetical protein